MLLMMSVFFKMMITDCLADKHCCKVSEYICLDKGHQNFNYINKHRKGNGHWRKSHTCGFGHFCKNEDQTHEAQYNDVPGSHVGEQPDD